MVKNARKVVVTVEEGNVLLQTASRFTLPEKLGDKSFTPAERAAATTFVSRLYAILKAHSPILIGKDRLPAFGPESCWTERRDQNGRKQYDLVSPDEEVELEFGLDEIEGAIWCLIALLHPQSAACRSASDQYDIVWPIAKKIGREGILREEVGLPVNEPPKSRFGNRKTDEDYAREGEKAS